jgi:sodium transport system permease protein
MRRVITIMKKEFVDTIRDKRTLITMIVIPLALIPLLMTGAVKFMTRAQDKADAAISRLAIIGGQHAPELVAALRGDSLVELREDVRAADLDSLIRADSIHGGVVVPPEFSRRVANDEQASVTVFFESSNQLGAARGRMEDAIESVSEDIVNGRIRRLDLDENLFEAIEIVASDVSSLQERFGKTAGGILPYMFVILCFTGAMYPGIDLSAGEKERGTLETILSSPASRLDIVLGKFVVVATVGFLSAILSMVGLYFGVRGMGELPPELMEVIMSILNTKVILMVASLLIPLAAFFSATILALAIYAKSFKEAQSILTPMSIVIIIPVMIGMLPGTELNMMTALVPVLNVSLATKEVIAGTIDPFLLTLCYVSLFALAAASIAFCVYWFNKESTLFRT